MTGESRPRVLVADDDQSIRQLLCTIVRREHVECDAVGDGDEAIAKLRQHDYAVILLDLMMPRGNGFDVIEYLKANPKPIKPVVLVITAYADQKFKEVDASIVAGVLRKPFEIADLGGIVRLCMSGYNAEITEKLYSSSDRSIRDFAKHQLHPDRPMNSGKNEGAPN